MIKFFRRIRKQLLTENKFSSYLIYAIGEIILVVIGILIALSINNWNDNRKDRLAEKALYKTLIKSLENDLKDVQDKYEIIDSAIIGQKIFITESFEEVASRFTDKEFFNLLYKVGNTSKSFVPNISLYNKILQNNQIDLIQSEALQMKITELYEVQYWDYKDLDATLESQAQLGLIGGFFGDISDIFINKNEKLDVEMIRNHYDELNKECRKIYFLSLATKESMVNCQRNIASVLQSIKDELKK
jgi:hypothetical protein